MTGTRHRRAPNSNRFSGTKWLKTLPTAFMSYAHVDDEHENGRLTDFRKRLSSEVRIQTGEEFLIFQDHEYIEWGQNWRHRIEEALNAATYLIPILTPSFFRSMECRNELQRFLKREKKLHRNDLILPVYYVSCPILDDHSKRAQDKLAQEIVKHNYFDWRELRFESFSSPEVGKAMARLAAQIRGW